MIRWVDQWSEFEAFSLDIYSLDHSCFGRSSWNSRTWRDLFLNRDLAVAIVIGDHRCPGFLVASSVLDEVEILKIGVALPCRRTGLGKQMLLSLISRSEADRVNRIFLEVRRKNLAAMGLYKSCGFQVVGARSRYYAGPLDDAILLALNPQRSDRG